MNERGGKGAAKSKLLYVAHSLPYPPDKGERIRAFHQLKELVREHRVHLVCFAERGAEGPGVAALEALGLVVHTVATGRFGNLARGVAAFARGLAREPHEPDAVALRRTLAELLAGERFDAMLASTLGVVEGVRHLAGIPKALDVMDVTSELWRDSAERRGFPFSWLDRVEARRLARYEHDALGNFDTTIVVSTEEARLLRRNGARFPIEVIGNGVDLEAFAPPRERAAVPPTIVFTGSMDYLPNVDAVRYFCRSILPRVRRAVDDVRFEIVGRNPTRAIRALQRQDGVAVTGFVPDVRPHLEQASVAVAPFRVARGVQNKILEAMACGVPVVGASRVLDALEVGAEDGARRADDPERFAREVAALLDDREWWATCSRAARRFVERRHAWHMHSPGRLLESIVAKRRAAPGGSR